MQKGFTLIELLVVIAILAVLAVAVILVLNPAELIKQGRDATRISDLGTVNSAIGYYLSTALTPDTNFGGTGKTCTTMIATTSPFSATAPACVPVVNALRNVDGTGWVKIKLTDAQGGSPLGSLPQDPVNLANFQYAFIGDDGTNVFELDGRLESSKYSGNMSSDGGDNPNWYEVGTKLDL